MSGPDPRTTSQSRRATVDVDAPNPVFLEQSGYRQRRLRDALRMLPVFGAVLWLLPLFRSGPEEGSAPGNAAMLIYIFAVWSGLIVLAWFLSRRLRFDTDAEDRGGGRQP